MVRSILTFRITPGRRQEFLDTFREISVLETSSFQAGYLGAELHLDLHDSDVALVTAVWESAAAYQGWLDNPVRQTLSDRLEPFMDGEPAGHLCQSLLEVAPNTPPRHDLSQ